jgi:hypothetical protein
MTPVLRVLDVTAAGQLVAFLSMFPATLPIALAGDG